MPPEDDSAAQRAQFDAMTAALDITIPEVGRDRIFEGYLGLRAMTRIVRRSRKASAEPAGIFVPDTIIRGDA